MVRLRGMAAAMAVSYSAADGREWRSHFYAAVRVRDRQQRDNYTAVIDAC